jgi:hypothetical protein
MAIPIGSYDRRCLCGRLQTEPSHPGKHIVGRQRSGVNTASSMIAISSPCNER